MARLVHREVIRGHVAAQLRLRQDLGEELLGDVLVQQALAVLRERRRLQWTTSLRAGLYSEEGRPSVPPEALLKASVLMAMYSIRSERAFCERLNYDLLFKWCLDMRIDKTSQSRRPRIEEPFGWMKTIAGGHQLRYISRERNNTSCRLDVGREAQTRVRRIQHRLVPVGLRYSGTKIVRHQ